jgi:WD40 repeat protein
MARGANYARRVRDSGGFGCSTTHRGHVPNRIFIRMCVCLIVSIFIIEAFVVDRTPIRGNVPMLLAEGEAGVGTLSMSVSRQGTLIATTDTAGRVSVRDQALTWQNGKYVDCTGFATSVTFTPDGRSLAIAGQGRGIAFWALEQPNGELTEWVPVPQVSVTAFSPDGRYLAAASAVSSQVVIWDRAERRESLILESRERTLSLAFSPDGRYLAAGGRGDRAAICVWDLDTGNVRFVLNESSGPVASVAFSPDGAMLATAAMFEERVRFWDMRTGGLHRAVEGHLFGTNSVEFSPDGRALASAGNDGMVRLWNVATGEPITVLDGRTIRLNRVGFSPDGRRIFATGSADNNIRIWDVFDLIPVADERAFQASIIQWIRWDGRPSASERRRGDLGKPASSETQPDRIPVIVTTAPPAPASPS